jgi:hypothetical protein
MVELIGYGVCLLILVVSFLILKKLRKKSWKLSEEVSKKEEEINSLKIRVSDLIEKFKPITDVQKQSEELRLELENKQSELIKLSEKYSKANSIYKTLIEEIKIYEDDLELRDFGVYKPHFNFDTSDDYKEQIELLSEEQKDMVRLEVAAICNTNWLVESSAKKGEMMTKRGVKLTLRAFNGECDALISKVKWNNIEQYSKRIQKAFDNINKLNKSNDISITEEYKELKLNELRLVHEYENKKHEEKEEQRRIREQIREEERANSEIQKALDEANENEKRYQDALEEAHKKLSTVQGKKLDKLNDQISKLELQLKEAHENSERAMSRAQMTKSGHVYVISNLGSFGENVYKIGMTRRLEPMDRVKELGDASVPFTFDVHAMIYSENAPELETTLHKEFNERRVNLVNPRKEYFNVKLNEIETAVNSVQGAEIEFTKIAEAEEYRETLSMLKQLKTDLNNEGLIVEDKFPDELF